MKSLPWKSVFLAIVSLLLMPLDADALVQRYRLPMAGCRGYLHAKGEISYVKYQSEKGFADGYKVVISVENVPLPPGTELLVYHDGNEIGAMKLDKKRGGTFEIESTFQRPAPVIKPSSFIVLRLVDGTNVMW